MCIIRGEYARNRRREPFIAMTSARWMTVDRDACIGRIIVQTQPLTRSLRESREIQGNILAGFRKDYQAFVFLRFPEVPERGRDWCRDLLDPALGIATTRDVAEFNDRFAEKRRASGADPTDLLAVWINVGFTFAGLQAITPREFSADVAHDFRMFPAFRDGAAARAAMLGDAGDSDPSRWVVGGEAEPLHAIVTIAADRKEALLEKLQALKDVSEDLIVHIEMGATFETKDEESPNGITRKREHFGFADGVSQPVVVGFDAPDDTPIEGTALVSADEFVLGRPGSIGERWAPPWMHNSSFQVFRRLAQDVKGWKQRVDKWHESVKDRSAATPDLLETRLIGRWPNGTPLALVPEEGMEQRVDDALKNSFDFRDDPNGEKTPRYAHSRRMYPRDNRRFRDQSRRIIRRGIPFGEPYSAHVEDKEPPEGRRGLLFNAFMASIEGQFEYLQRSWANNPYFPGIVLDDREPVEEGIDPVIGSTNHADREPSPAAPAADPSDRHPPNFQRFVHTTGAVYAFVPSYSTIRLLAGVDLAGSQD